jgi:anti-anti-sigma factor
MPESVTPSETKPSSQKTSDDQQEGRRIIILDLAGVTAIDSTGIGLVISTYNTVIGAQGQLRIAGAAGHLLDVFHVSRLDTVFPLYATVEDAVRS